MALTDEQEKIVACNDPMIVVNAYAGSGKTTTLAEYAKHRPGKRFLYLAYNKAMQVEAAERFPSNVVTSTTHSLAYRSVGARYRNKLGDIRPVDVSDVFGGDYRSAKLAIETLKNFFASDKPGLTEDHVPIEAVGKTLIGNAISLAKKIWMASVDKDGRMPMPHDGYLKLYAMTKPDLSDRFDSILFDEAQDANPVTSQIVFSQAHLQKMVVGDRYQAIYGFRGAANAMEMLSEVDAAHFHLTKSFRFGPDVAALASMILNEIRGEERPLVGMRPGRTAGTVDPSRPYAHLHRTNADLLRTAAWCAERNVPFSLLGGVGAYAFENILDVHRLFSRNTREIKNGLIRRFGSMSELTDYADAVDDIPLKGMIKIVEEYRDNIPFMISLVKKRAIEVHDLENPPRLDNSYKKNMGLVTLTTAHRSKGLGFDQVLLSDDYHSLFDKGTGDLIAPTDRKEEEEVNLIYVALTRAKAALQINDDLRRFQDLILSRSQPAVRPVAPSAVNC